MRKIICDTYYILHFRITLYNGRKDTSLCQDQFKFLFCRYVNTRLFRYK